MSGFARLCFFFFIISCLGCAQKPIKKQNLKWQSFVLDEDLSQFQVLNGTADYYVENNTIVGVSTIGSPNTFLCTRELYSDFILEFEVWADPQLNSGVQFRSNRFDDKMDG